VAAVTAGSARTTIVVPTVGRPSLATLLRALAGQTRPLDVPVVLVDDRPGDREPLAAPGDPDYASLDVTVVRSGGRGPAAARNRGWRTARTPWVSFLDDDVVPLPTWHDDLLADLDAAESAAEEGVVGSEGHVRVPLPVDRRPTDWERGTKGLEDARWITADLTYARTALASVGGFDERFPRAFREDADLALRLGADRGTVVLGRRGVLHPVRPADDWASVRQQAGNADDELMRALHGPDWFARAHATVGRWPRHAAITGAAVTAGLAVLTGHRRLAALAAAGWAVGTADFAWARIEPGPRDRAEVRRMVLTSVAIPPVATWHRLRGRLRHRGATPWRGLPDLVLLDRDGTLVEDVPYNGDPALVRPKPDARASLDRLRAAGVRLGLVTNQSGVARGYLGIGDVDQVNARVAELVGPFDTVQVCPHGPDDGCDCRKPAPGMVLAACEALGADPARTVLIGDIGADVGAAEAAGAVGILVPTPVTRLEEVEAAAYRADSLSAAVAILERGHW
jgi:histidinol-phosphate phosphatase family protein